MPTIEAEVSTRALLRAVAQLQPTELDAFVAAVLALQAERAGPAASAAEAALLQTIRRPQPTELSRRCRELTARRRAATLTAEEHDELLRLTDTIEIGDAARVQALGQLAHLRGKTLAEITAELGLQVPPYE